VSETLGENRNWPKKFKAVKEKTLFRDGKS
jgi:hypothetical protein